MWFDKGHGINSWIIIWISNVANSRNVDLTGKQHSRHQQCWRFPLSPLEAGGRLPRSRDHLFSYSMSKASPPQGPDMWYLTFYENKVPIYQTTISNSLYYCAKLWSKTQRSTLEICLYNLVGTMQTIGFVRSLSNFICKLLMMREFRVMGSNV